MKKYLGFTILLFWIAGCSHIQERIERGYDLLDNEAPYLTIDISFNPDKYKFNIYPQFAVWLEFEDENGELTYQTVYATQGTANNQWVKIGGKLVRRKEATPVWKFARKNETDIDIDAVSGATPVGHLLTLYVRMPDDMMYKQVHVYTEVNISFDYNFYYFFHPVNGQPSVVWKADINLDQIEHGHTAEAEIIGHGNVWGSNTKIYEDVSHVTSAKRLLHFVKVGYFEQLLKSE